MLGKQPNPAISFRNKKGKLFVGTSNGKNSFWFKPLKFEQQWKIKKEISLQQTAAADRWSVFELCLPWSWLCCSIILIDGLLDGYRRKDNLHE
ncbi:hypothetical protein FRX31_007464 [Thalictrum thalictroides]|uniref:Uncharacterized protein n=1 Tax=Thalictrum thalictroides TaxID=46969 RepID=A0A7J6X2P3_THATH|nr:hypothetical protein FRX31_007464 [Thalictrum thalictroides]